MAEEYIQVCPGDEQKRKHGYEEILMPDGSKRCTLYLHGMETVTVGLYPSGNPQFVSSTDWRIGHKMTMFFKDNWIPSAVDNSMLRGEMNGHFIFQAEGPQFLFDEDGKPTYRLDCMNGENIPSSHPQENAAQASWALFKDEAAWATTLIKWCNEEQRRNTIVQMISGVGVPRTLQGFKKFSSQKPTGKSKRSLRKVLAPKQSGQKKAADNSNKRSVNTNAQRGFDHRAHNAVH